MSCYEYIFKDCNNVHKKTKEKNLTEEKHKGQNDL